MLRTFRFQANLQFTLNSVPNDIYDVYVWVFEDGPSSINATLSVNGSVVVASYNTGPTGHWDRLGPYATTVSANNIQVTYVCNTPGEEGLLSGVEVWRHSTPTPTPTPTQLQPPPRLTLRHLRLRHAYTYSYTDTGSPNQHLVALGCSDWRSSHH